MSLCWCTCGCGCSALSWTHSKRTQSQTRRASCADMQNNRSTLGDPSLHATLVALPTLNQLLETRVSMPHQWHCQHRTNSWRPKSPCHISGISNTEPTLGDQSLHATLVALPTLNQLLETQVSMPHQWHCQDRSNSPCHISGIANTEQLLETESPCHISGIANTEQLLETQVSMPPK